MANKEDLKIGLFGIGLEAYWEQFDGLKSRLENYISIVQQKLENFNAEIVNLGLIDTPEKAFDAGKAFRKADVDIIFLYATTYAFILNGFTRCATRKGTGYHPEPCAGTIHRL